MWTRNYDGGLYECIKQSNNARMKTLEEGKDKVYNGARLFLFNPYHLRRADGESALIPLLLSLDF